MDKTPTISVTIGIPAYNQAEYLRETIKGCLEQDYSLIRIIVADDRSSDDSYDVARNYSSDSRIEVIRNEKNLGRVGNYRKLLYDYAASDWYLNLDGDDYLIDPHFISNAIKIVSLV